MQKIEELFNEYSSVRSHQLTQDQFATVLSLIPALIVATSDGVMDSKEWTLVNKLAKMLGDELIPDDIEGVIEKEEALMKVIRDEVGYIMRNISKWEEKVMDALKEHVADNTKSKEFISETMHLFAATSSGFSKQEEEKIDSLTETLGL